MDSVLNKHADVFSPGLGAIKGVKARIVLNENSRPRSWNARPVPLAWKPLVEQQLDNLKRNGLVKRIQHSEWAAPIVTPMKRDNTFRICGDFKVTVNPQLDRHRLLPFATDR